MNPPANTTTKNLLEWAVFAMSTVLILAVTACLVWFALRNELGPPRLDAKTGAPEVQAGWIHIPVRVSNSGHRVAANVRVVVSGRLGAGIREGSFTIGFIPQGGTGEGVVTFQGEDVPVDLKCEVIGYETP